VGDIGHKEMHTEFLWWNFLKNTHLE